MGGGRDRGGGIEECQEEETGEEKGRRRGDKSCLLFSQQTCWVWNMTFMRIACGPNPNNCYWAYGHAHIYSHARHCNIKFVKKLKQICSLQYQIQWPGKSWGWMESLWKKYLAGSFACTDKRCLHCTCSSVKWWVKNQQEWWIYYLRLGARHLCRKRRGTNSCSRHAALKLQAKSTQRKDHLMQHKCNSCCFRLTQEKKWPISENDKC